MSDQTLIKLDQIRSTYLSLLAQIEAISKMQADLIKAGLCNGSEYWRREDGKPDRLYANHGEGQACDIHGQKFGNRLRKYIGSDPEKIQECLDAMQRYREWSQLNKAKYEIESTAFIIRNKVSNTATYGRS